mmetsp:Transcript_23255/g.54988  ORF Transcript_23255/g.54988 Transcript_23255/m.54988 type:complete len:163 (-) Transcript_23255:176-664(-)
MKNLSTALLLSISYSSKLLFPISALSFSAAATKMTVRVKGSGVESVNMDYEWTSANLIPPGFERVCVQNRWGVKSTWEKLNNGKPWLRASNDAYIYLNAADDQWWIDKPDGAGVFVAPKDEDCGSCNRGDPLYITPPLAGWRALSPSYNPAPAVVVMSDVKK